ncbi:MAG: transporter substrate-binding domain-containing protein [Pseudomonadota bacterium]
MNRIAPAPRRQLPAWPFIPLLLGAACAHAASAAIEVRLMAQESIAPKWIAHEGASTGLCPDIVAAIEKIEPRLRFSSMGVGRSVPVIEKGLESGAVAAACALLDTPHRRQIAHIVGKPLYTVRHRLAGVAGEKADINNLADLIRLNAVVTTTRGAGYTEQLRALGLQVDDTSGDVALNLRKVLGGHGRFVYLNELTLGWYIRAEGLDTKMYLLPAVLKEEPIYFWMSQRADPAAVALVEHAINSLADSGELKNIYQRWSGVH